MIVVHQISDLLKKKKKSGMKKRVVKPYLFEYTNNYTLDRETIIKNTKKSILNTGMSQCVRDIYGNTDVKS